MSNDSNDRERAKDEKLLTIKNSIDLSIVGDNILDIAEFTVEKYEFRNDKTLSSEMREEAVGKIKDALWNKIEQLKLRRTQILKGMFDEAEKTLGEVVGQ